MNYTDPSGHRPVIDEDEDNVINGTFSITIQLDKNSPYIVDYYADSLSDPNVGFDPMAVIDFLMLFMSLIPFENRGDDTIIAFDYSISASQFTIEDAYLLSSFDGPGYARFEGIEFKTGLSSSSSIYNNEFNIISDEVNQIINEPLVFSSENTLVMDIYISCIGCYNTGSGLFSILITERVTIPMGRCELYSYENIGTLVFPWK